MESEKKLVAEAKSHIARAHYQTVTVSGKHAVIADEPEELSGTDTGMNPFGLLLSSLGSCTAITLRMYIDRKMWIVDEIHVAMEIFKTKEGHVIESNVSFKGELTSEQTQRLLEIADHCPIHKLLAGNIKIATQIECAPVSAI